MNTYIKRCILVGGILLLVSTSACFAKPKKTPVWENASLAYSLCSKMYNLSDWEKAAYAFTQFVEKYPSSQNTPIAYVQMAHCYFSLGKGEEAMAALDTVIKKFSASRITANVWGKKLDIAGSQKDYDQWLDLYETLSKQFGKAPMSLPNRIDWRRINDYWWSINNTHFYYPRWRRTGWYLQAASTKMGWVERLLRAANTPIRALRALEIIAKTLKAYGNGLPEDWKYAHILLLRKAAEMPKEPPAKSDTTSAAEKPQTKPATKHKKPKKYKPVPPEAAEKQFQAYLSAYPKNDPHIIGLWMREAQYWSSRDPQKTDKIWIDMIEAFPGYDSLGNFATKRMNFLYKKRRYRDFVKMGLWYLKYFPLGSWRESAINRWVTMVEEKAEQNNTSQVKAVLKIIDEEQKRYPLDPLGIKRNIERRLDLHLAVGNIKQAVKSAGKLISKPYWSAESWKKLNSLAQGDKEFEPILAGARKTFGIPAPQDTSSAKPVYESLLARIKDNQTRHMEELGDKLFSKYRNDAYTILGVKALVDYYFSSAIVASG